MVSKREAALAVVAFAAGAALMLGIDKSVFFDIAPSLTAATHAAGGAMHGTGHTSGSAGSRHAAPSSEPLPPGRWSLREDPVLNLTNTAFISMASSDESGKLALAMFQSLRDVGTQVPHLVLMLARGGVGSADCQSTEWRKANGRENIRCSGPDTIPAEIVSERYLKQFARLGVEVAMVDPIPPTPFTKDIPGGTQSFWGMAFNKLLVFNMTRFRKIAWLDADDYFVKNVDHLMAKPTFTGSFVTACCHAVGPAYPGGGIWVLEPSERLFATVMRTINHPRPGTMNDGWNLGDMQVIRYVFGAAPYDGNVEPLWPAINDQRHGYAGGLRYFSKYKAMSDEEFEKHIDSILDGRKLRREGFIEELADPTFPSWQALDMRYDQCVGTFNCAPERDEPDVVFSVHFSCLQTAQKPSQYESEHALMEALTKAGGADKHTRYWFLRWYETFKRATEGEGFDAPKWAGPPVTAE